MMLGATYAGGIYFFTGVLRSRQWHRVKVGYLALLPFVTMLGIATLLHWDRFTHNHISFIAWTALYFTTPFVILAVWLRNRSQDPGQPDSQDAPIPFPVRASMGAMFSLPGAVGLCLAFEWRWSAAKLILQAQSFSILFILIAAARAWTEFDAAAPGSWLFVGGLGMMLASIVSLYFRMETRQNTGKAALKTGSLTHSHTLPAISSAPYGLAPAG